MLLYYALVNASSTPVDGATLQVRTRFHSLGRATAVWFDAPPP